MRHHVLICALACFALAGCASRLPGTDGVTRDHARNDDGRGRPQRPMYLPATGVMKKSDTPGKVGDDDYVCADKACTTAIKVK